MGLISASSAQRLKRISDTTLPERCTITRLPAVDGTMRSAGGTVTMTPEVVASDVPCRVSRPSADHLADVGDQAVPSSRRLLVVKAGTDLRPGDLAAVTLSKGGTLHLRVFGVLGPETNEVMRRAVCGVGDGP